MKNKMFGTFAATAVAGLLASNAVYAEGSKGHDTKKAGADHKGSAGECISNSCAGHVKGGTNECAGHVAKGITTKEACEKGGGTWKTKA